MNKWKVLVENSGLRIALCAYCDNICLAAKRSLCCGDAAYVNDIKVSKFLEDNNDN